ncbi:MAG TPA: acyl-CoA dehydratase activase [bacterium]|jgi:predicted CoA-substrate-specific enzyme activase
MSGLLRCAGIDIGSRSVELVVMEGETVVHSRIAPSGFDPLASANALLAETHYDRLIATGYGRHLLELAQDVETVTEIKAYARGAGHALPGCRTVLDIGGQDVKAISIGDNGRVVKFEMNDRCAAGSGKFLEIMAHTLGYTLEEFGPAALTAQHDVSINSMCTVFAESEVTSLLHKGASRADIALAVHRSIVKRAVGMVNRVAVTEPLLFAGGGALNPCTRRLLAEALGMEIHVPEAPQMLGALGAARLSP